MALDFQALMRHERAQAKKLKDEQAKSVIAPQQMTQCLACLAAAPATVRYLDNFLGQDEQRGLQQAIDAQPKNGWLRLPKRSLLNLGGVPHPDGMIAEALPDFLDQILQKLDHANVFASVGRPNQVLLNDYAPGRGIDAHNDGPLFEPVVAIISLGTPALLRFHDPPPPGAVSRTAGEVCGSVVLRPGSLLIFEDTAYHSLWHSVVDDVSEEQVSADTWNRDLVEASVGDVLQRGRRSSLTMRKTRTVAMEAGEYWDEGCVAEVHRRQTWWANSISEKGTGRVVHASSAYGAATRPAAAHRSTIIRDEGTEFRAEAGNTTIVQDEQFLEAQVCSAAGSVSS